MTDAPLPLLLGTVFVLILLSALVAGSETGLMALDRQRLRHLARSQHPGALRARRLLRRPEHLCGVIRLLHHFLNLLAAALTALIGWHLAGPAGVLLGIAILTLVMLLLVEATSRTLAFHYSERMAFPAAWFYAGLLRLLYPIIWLSVRIPRGLLRGTVARRQRQASGTWARLTASMASECDTAPEGGMPLSLTVRDIMVPRTEMTALSLDQDWDKVVARITRSEYTRLPVYRKHGDRVAGILHVRNVISLLAGGRLEPAALDAALQPPYFIPENTPIDRQLLNFQRENRRLGLVVNEYGDLLGLVTVEDILVALTGGFTGNPAARLKKVNPQSDGTYLVEGTASVRILNQVMGWRLPTGSARTLNGLILEHLESIPQPGTSLLLGPHPVEIVQTRSHAVRTVRIRAPLEDAGGQTGRPAS